MARNEKTVSKQSQSGNEQQHVDRKEVVVAVSSIQCVWLDTADLWKEHMTWRLF